MNRFVCTGTCLLSVYVYFLFIIATLLITLFNTHLVGSLVYYPPRNVRQTLRVEAESDES